MPKKTTVVKIVEGRTTELHIAAQKGEVNRLKMLVQNGADVNVCDRDDATPLHHASYNGHGKIVKKVCTVAALCVVQGNLSGGKEQRETESERREVKERSGET
jgi:ankyrin repeat protein